MMRMKNNSTKITLKVSWFFLIYIYIYSLLSEKKKRVSKKNKSRSYIYIWIIRIKNYLMITWVFKTSHI